MRIQTKFVLPEPLARRSKFYYYFGKIIFDFSKKWYFFGENSLLPSQCPTKQLQYDRSGSVGGFDSPLVQCRSVGLSVVFERISPEWIWRARGVRHNFGTLTPSPIFPKICHYFGTFTPSRIFPNICHNFGAFHEYKLWEFSLCVSVILNLPHATVALLNSL